MLVSTLASWWASDAPDLLRGPSRWFRYRTKHEAAQRYAGGGSLAVDPFYCEYGWGSVHPGGMNWLFGDGSVRNITINIDMVIFQSAVYHRWR